MALITLNDSVIQDAKQAIGDLITIAGKDCRLIYNSRIIECNNCVFDPIGRKSSNVYKHGGPYPFDIGLCPVCGGSGGRVEEITEVIKAHCNWNPSEWTKYFPDINIRYPNNKVMTRTWLTNLPKIKSCNEMVVIFAENYISARFKLAGEPIDDLNVFKGTFCVALWEQA